MTVPEVDDPNQWSHLSEVKEKVRISVRFLQPHGWGPSWDSPVRYLSAIPPGIFPPRDQTNSHTLQIFTIQSYSRKRDLKGTVKASDDRGWGWESGLSASQEGMIATNDWKPKGQVGWIPLRFPSSTSATHMLRLISLWLLVLMNESFQCRKVEWSLGNSHYPHED